MRRLNASTRTRWMLILALVLLVPAIPARAVPCDDYRVDLATLPARNVRVVVAVDEAWRQTYGDDSETRATLLLADVNRIMEPAGIRLSVTEYRNWSSTEYAGSMSSMLSHLDASVPAQPGKLVIGLTGRQISRVDGLAHVGHIHLVARLHQDRPQLDGLVVAHEIGHLLGADHHECEHDYQCVMAPKGFSIPARWCDHHVLEVQLGAGTLLVGQEA